eukprot:TCONS_00006525-protein
MENTSLPSPPVGFQTKQQEDAFIVDCSNMIWFYPNHPSYQISLRLAIFLNTIFSLLSIVVNLKNCQRLLRHKDGKAPSSNIVIFSGCVTDMVTAFMILTVWNVQSIMAVNHQFSCPVSFFTYLIVIVAAFIICMTTILLIADRYLIVTCPFLYEEHITKNASTYGKIIAYIFIIALILSGIGFAISPQVLYFIITVPYIGCLLWAVFVYPALFYERFYLTTTYTSYQLKVGLHERRNHEKLTKCSCLHSFMTVFLLSPHLIFTYGWFQKNQQITSLMFHTALLWSWVMIALKLVISAISFSFGIEGRGFKWKIFKRKLSKRRIDDIQLKKLTNI